MAGGAILPTRTEYRLIRRLSPHHMATLLTMLDEAGWAVAQVLLRGYATYPEYQENQEEKP